MNELLVNIDKIHTTDMGLNRIKRNLNINNDVVEYCKNKILDEKCIITKKRKELVL